jgi:Zn-dependent peptidase ImmA (M78 family)
MSVRTKHIRVTAERLIASNGVLAAPVPVDKLAAALGTEVRREPAEDDLSGFLMRGVDGRRAVIGVNSSHHPNRQRFTIAHEIGHLLLHDGEKIHVDRTGQVYQVNLRSEASSAGTDIAEIEANAFAAELLMPAAFLRADLADQRTLNLLDEDVLDTLLKPLARKYGVSPQALTFRLGRLGYVQV